MPAHLKVGRAAKSIEASLHEAELLAQAKGALTGERTIVSDDVRAATTEAKAFLQDLRETANLAFDNDEVFDEPKLATFNKGYGKLTSTEKVIEAMNEALRRVATATAALEARNDGEAFAKRGTAIVAKLRKGTKERAAKVVQLSPAAQAFQMAKGRVLAQIKNASRAGGKTFRTTDPQKAASYSMHALGLRKGGVRKPKKQTNGKLVTTAPATATPS